MTIPAVPPIADADRYQSYVLTSATAAVDLAFPLFGDGTDLEIRLDGTLLTTGWTLVSKSGLPLTSLPLPIADGQIQFSPSLTTGHLEIWGAWRPRMLVMPSGAAITRRDINLLEATIIAAQRELFTRYHQLTVAFLELDPAAIADGIADAQAASAAAATAAATASAAATNAAASFLTLLQSLPTTLPATSGQPWNNGGVVCIS